MLYSKKIDYLCLSFRNIKLKNLLIFMVNRLITKITISIITKSGGGGWSYVVPVYFDENILSRGYREHIL